MEECKYKISKSEIKALLRIYNYLSYLSDEKIKKYSLFQFDLDTLKNILKG